MSTPNTENIPRLFPVGQVVRVRDPAHWHADVAAKIADRMGEVTSHVSFAGHPIVTFHAIGRRKTFQKSFSNPDLYLDRVTDAAAVEAWRKEVAHTAARAKARLAKKPTAARG